MEDTVAVPSAVVIQKLSHDGRLQRILRTETEGMYVLGPQLGVGGISRVVSARNVNNGQSVAVKIVERGFQGNAEMSNEFRAMQEIKCLTSLSHPNIVGFLSYHRTEDCIYIIQELVNGISLLDYLKHKGNRINTGAALHIFFQAAMAVEYLHNNGVYHRDLKLENMIVDINGSVQIIDFDLAHKVSDIRNLQKLDVFCGTPHIACPEIWRAEPYDGSKADIWSLGVILYVLLTGAYPFDGDDLSELRDAILNEALEIPLDLPGPMKDLLSRMLDKNPYKRICTKELCQHPLVAEARKQSCVVNEKLKNGRRPGSTSPPEEQHSSSNSTDTVNNHGARGVRHKWKAPVVDDAKAVELSMELGSDEEMLLPPKTRRKGSIGSTTSQPNTPIWNGNMRGPSPLSSNEHTSSAGANRGNFTFRMGSDSKEESPDRRDQICEFLDYIFENNPDLSDLKTSEGLSVQQQQVLLDAAKDSKILRIPPPNSSSSDTSSSSTPTTVTKTEIKTRSNDDRSNSNNGKDEKVVSGNDNYNSRKRKSIENTATSSNAATAAIASTITVTENTENRQSKKGKNLVAAR